MQNQAGYNRGYNNYKPNPHLSYRSTIVANPQDQIYTQQLAQKPSQSQHQQPQPDFASMFQQLLQGQAASKLENAKQFATLHQQYHDLNTKVDSIASRVNHLESYHSSTSNVKSSGQLPGKAIQNPKEFCNAIHLDAEDEQDSIEVIAAVAKDAPLLVSEDSDSQDGETLLDTEEKAEKPTIDLGIDQPHRRTTSISSPLSVEEPEISTENRSSFDPPPYKPKLPFPGRFKKKLIAEHQAKIDEQMKILESKMPLIEAVKLIPKSHEYLKDLVMKRIKVTQGEKLDSEECGAVVSKEEATPEKLGDPGSFTLPCSLGPKTFSSCLCDLGSSVSLMPFSVAKRLGYKEYSPTNISLILADRSVRKPHGLLKDLPVRVGKVKIPTDFIVLDMDEEPKDPLLLGRPFLATAGAVIDVKHGKIELNLGKGIKMTFDVRNVAKKPTIEGQTFSIEEMVQDSEASLEPSAKDHPTQTCNAILISDGDEVWEEEENVKNDYALRLDEETLDGECLHSLFDVNKKGVTYEEVSTGKKDFKKNKKEIHPPSLVLTSNSMSLHPLRLVDGAIEYKVKCKGPSTPFASVRAKLHPQLQGSKAKLQELLSRVLTIDLHEPPWA